MLINLKKIIVVLFIFFFAFFVFWKFHKIKELIKSFAIYSVTIVQKPNKVNETISTTTKDIVVKNDSVDYLLKSMHLTFSEEFDELSLYVDKNGKTTCESGGVGRWQTVLHFCSRTIWTNHEAELYIDPSFLSYWKDKRPEGSITSISPFSIEKGILSIMANPAEKEIQTIAGPWAQYTSGLLTTEFSFSQTYGYFEMRAKFPKGEGLWPAFWLLPIDETWPPEIDIVEFFGGKNEENQGGLTMIHNASHIVDPKLSKYCGTWHDMKVDVTKDFHTYGVNWQPDGITYYFDGKPYTTCPPNPLANKPFYILVNLAVGGAGSWPGTPDSSNLWPAYVYIDYIRAYSHN